MTRSRRNMSPLSATFRREGHLYTIMGSYRSTVLIIVTVILTAFLVITILSGFRSTPISNTKSHAVDHPIGSQLPSYHASSLDTEWQSITIKGQRSNESWSLGGEGIVFRRIMKQWKDRTVECNTNDTLIPMSFSTPGGSVTVYVYDADDRIVFQQGGIPLLTPVLTLMAEDPTVTFIDIGADIGLSSLAVASLGNQVLAVEPYMDNLPKLCHGIMDSDLIGRVYVVTNAILDSNKLVKVNPSMGKIKHEYTITTQRNRKGNMTSSILLHEVMEKFPMSRAGIRLGTHDNITAVLTGAVQFFQEVDVQFVQVSWFYAQGEKWDQFLLQFLSDRDFNAYGYWSTFVLLDVTKPRTWPDNVIFRKERKRSPEDENMFFAETDK